MYCVIEKDWLKCLVSDNELLELEHLPTTTVKPVGLEVSLCNFKFSQLAWRSVFVHFKPVGFSVTDRRNVWGEIS